MLQTIRRLLIRPGCFQLERELPGGVRTHDIDVPWQGTQWNRIEHRLFAFISQNWRGKPLLTHQVIIQLIASTTTQTGLTVQCRLDQNTYEKGTKVSDAEIANLNITPAEFHGEWNYTIAPQPKPT